MRGNNPVMQNISALDNKVSGHHLDTQILEKNETYVGQELMKKVSASQMIQII